MSLPRRIYVRSERIPRWRRRFAALLLALGLLGLLHALWIPLKAALAQQLIAGAYARSLEAQQPQRPWPWADTWPAARLQVPRLQVQRYVLADASPRSLAFGPGLLGADTQASPGLSVAGHRDTHFAFLGALRIGDELLWEDRQGTRRFRFARREIADIRVHRLARPAPGELQLSTCWPLHDWQPGGPLRLVWVAQELNPATQSAGLEPALEPG